jgi:hypothetical protein
MFESVASLILDNSTSDIDRLTRLGSVSSASCVVLGIDFGFGREYLTAARLIGYATAQQEAQSQSTNVTHIASPKGPIVHDATVDGEQATIPLSTRASVGLNVKCQR